ncbi:MAG: hypothetical protein RJB38_1479 [Pseudomonadota bacterium]|jgi:outer membrane beta-barrel protein
MEAKTLKLWGGRLIWIVGAGVWLSMMAGAWSRADAAESGAASAGTTDSSPYEFSWLDPEKKIYVLQNRKFTKAGRLMLSVLGGVGSNPYRKVYGFEPRVALYFSESLGVEVFYTKWWNSSNTTFRSLEASSGATTLPLLREIRGQMGGLIHWVPWYAKINVFNQILYFDWGFQLGLGRLDAVLLSKQNSTDPFSEQADDQTAFLAGTSQQFFLNQDWSVRLDVLGTFYNATYSKNSGDKTWFSTFQFGAGLGYRL